MHDACEGWKAGLAGVWEAGWVAGLAGVWVAGWEAGAWRVCTTVLLHYLVAARRC